MRQVQRHIFFPVFFPNNLLVKRTTEWFYVCSSTLILRSHRIILWNRNRKGDELLAIKERERDRKVVILGRQRGERERKEETVIGIRMKIESEEEDSSFQ